MTSIKCKTIEVNDILTIFKFFKYSDLIFNFVHMFFFYSFKSKYFSSSYMKVFSQFITSHFLCLFIIFKWKRRFAKDIINFFLVYVYIIIEILHSNCHCTNLINNFGNFLVYITKFLAHFLV